MPVSAYLIECSHGKILFDCGWDRDMSPNGKFDRKSQMKSLGGFLLYKTNQGVLPIGDAIDEQLAEIEIRPADLDLVLLSHLDCDHVNGLKLVKNAKRILVANDELKFAENGSLMNKIRYNNDWWNGTKIEGFDWNGSDGPVKKSYDVFGDGSLVMINIPGHCEGLCALKITNDSGKYVLLFADGGYAKKSWKEQITSGIADDKEMQKKSLEWIREQSLNPDCVESLANHDPDVEPHLINL
ncbi:MBL fold metallo-hydrolase [uncultured Methanobrevibacter sp.]|uniref:MBL fold metallo-hydrolase n=1 Tax=uncultured Methanobrevibacter sp. TaxID=253161 RepID=UPI00262D230B|nr:MBL fold metallo-hydrolase [uncultured Methanobrevibacter sp.]